MEEALPQLCIGSANFLFGVLFKVSIYKERNNSAPYKQSVEDIIYKTKLQAFLMYA